MTVVPLPQHAQPARRTGEAGVPRPPTASIAPGTGELHFTSVRGATALTRALAASPLKILNPGNAGTSAWAYLATYGGGLLGGDSLSIRVEVHRGAAALVATQASTKVYRSRLGATVRVHARVAGDGLLVVLPDPVTAFAGSRYTQEQDIHVDAGANLVLVDWLTAGRVGSGERWLFDGYHGRTFLWRGGRLALHEALSLTPEDGDLADRFHRFNCVAMAVLMGPALRAAAARLSGSLASAAMPRRADLLLSAAPLGDDGVLLRIAGLSAEQVGAVLRQHLNVVPALLGDDPWRTKF